MIANELPPVVQSWQELCLVLVVEFRHLDALPDFIRIKHRRKTYLIDVRIAKAKQAMEQSLFIRFNPEYVGQN